MHLRGIATALYGTEEKSTVSVTTLDSESADQIYIESTQKIQINPSDTAEMRNALLSVLEEICKQQPQLYQPGEQCIQIPTAVIYGVPEKHPMIYQSTLLDAFPEHLSHERKDGNVVRSLEQLILTYYGRYGQPGSRIECKPFHLYLPEKEEEKKQTIYTEENVNKELQRLHDDAKMGDANALGILRGYAKYEAQQYISEIRAKDIEVPRFVHYGPIDPNFQGTNRYTALGWFDLRDVFINELIRYMPMPHNVCLKVPGDKLSPPFADICATQLADYWDILEGRQQKRHVFARQSREEPYS